MPSNDSHRRLRVGIVGAGHISEFHLIALQRVNVELVAITDIDIAQAEARAKQFSIANVARSVEQLWKYDLDVVHVLTPPSSHAEITIQALRHSCHVMVEKPLAESVEDCDAIIRVAEETGKRVSVDHSLLLDPFTVQASEIVRRGEIGRVISVDCQRNQDLPPYLGGSLPVHYQDGGYPFRDLGIHALYQIELFLGKIVNIDWCFDQFGSDKNLQFDDWRATVRCENGSAHVHLSWAGRPFKDMLTIQGTEGIIVVDRFGMRVTRTRNGRLPEHPMRLYNAVSESLQTLWQVPLNLARVLTKRIRRYHGLQEVVADFYHRLNHDLPTMVQASDARRIGYWIEQVASDADQRKLQIRSGFQSATDADILLTGATGLIGGELLTRLSQTNQKVRILSRAVPEGIRRAHPNVEIVLGDLGDPNAVERAVDGVQKIFHVGGVVDGSHEEFYRGNVVGTRNVVDSAIRFGIKQLIYISSLSVLDSGSFRSDTPIAEDWPLEPKAEKRGSYTQTKLEAEQIVVEAQTKSDLPVVILRPGEVVGPGAPLLSSGVAHQVGSRLLVIGNGKLNVPMIHVADLVDAIVAAEKKNIVDGTILHLVDTQPISQNELVAEFVKITQNTGKVNHIPKLFLYSAALGLQLGLGLLGKSSPLSIYRLRSALTHRKFDCSAAEKTLDWSIRRGVKQGIADAFDAIRFGESKSTDATSISISGTSEPLSTSADR